jgi:hypothetical protein
MYSTSLITPVFTQAIQHGRELRARAAGQGQRSQCIERVVFTANAQGIGRHQALDMNLFFLVTAALAAFIGFVRTHQPGHAVNGVQAIVAGARGQAQTK